MYDIASSPNDPVFIHHLMLDCILLEWAKRHPDTEYPIHSLIRDRHRKRDFVRNYSFQMMKYYSLLWIKAQGGQLFQL